VFWGKTGCAKEETPHPLGVAGDRFKDFWVFLEKDSQNLCPAASHAHHSHHAGQGKAENPVICCHAVKAIRIEGLLSNFRVKKPDFGFFTHPFSCIMKGLEGEHRPAYFRIR
jgi:hypothetical protein